jgi:hypothetical protein
MLGELLELDDGEGGIGMLALDWLWLADWQATRITPIPPANANFNRFIDLSLQDCAH